MYKYNAFLNKIFTLIFNLDVQNMKILIFGLLKKKV